MSAIWNSVRGFEPLSLCDWPGRTACVIFLGGCNLRCPTCHNADLAWSPGVYPPIDQDRVKGHVRRRKKWLDGIVVSGGEPTLLPELPSLLQDLKQFGLPIKVDTNGMRPGVVENILKRKLADAFFVDVKGPYDKYPELTGGKVMPLSARTNLSRIFLMAKTWPDAFVFRTTWVPRLDENDIAEARSYLPPSFKLKLQKFQAPGRMYAQTDNEERRMSGDMVVGPHSLGHSQGAEGQRSQGSAALQAACA